MGLGPRLEIAEHVFEKRGRPAENRQRPGTVPGPRVPPGIGDGIIGQRAGDGFIGIPRGSAGVGDIAELCAMGHRRLLHGIAPFVVRGKAVVALFGEQVRTLARDVVSHGDVRDARVPGIAGHLLRLREGLRHRLGAAQIAPDIVGRPDKYRRFTVDAVISRKVEVPIEPFPGHLAPVFRRMGVGGVVVRPHNRDLKLIAVPRLTIGFEPVREILMAGGPVPIYEEAFNAVLDGPFDLPVDHLRQAFVVIAEQRLPDGIDKADRVPFDVHVPARKIIREHIERGLHRPGLGHIIGGLHGHGCEKLKCGSLAGQGRSVREIEEKPGRPRGGCPERPRHHRPLTERKCRQRLHGVPLNERQPLRQNQARAGGRRRRTAVIDETGDDQAIAFRAVHTVLKPEMKHPNIRRTQGRIRYFDGFYGETGLHCGLDAERHDGIAPGGFALQLNVADLKRIGRRHFKTQHMRARPGGMGPEQRRRRGRTRFNRERDPPFFRNVQMKRRRHERAAFGPQPPGIAAVIKFPAIRVTGRGGAFGAVIDAEPVDFEMGAFIQIEPQLPERALGMPEREKNDFLPEVRLLHRKIGHFRRIKAAIRAFLLGSPVQLPFACLSGADAQNHELRRACREFRLGIREKGVPVNGIAGKDAVLDGNMFHMTVGPPESRFLGRIELPRGHRRLRNARQPQRTQQQHCKHGDSPLSADAAGLGPRLPRIGAPLNFKL